MPVQSSQDILYIVLALCVLWFTVFLCWLLYQAARVLRNANRIIESLARKLELISDAVEFIKQRVDGLSSHMGVVRSLATGFMEKYVVGKLTKKFSEKMEEEEKVEKKKYNPALRRHTLHREIK